MHQIQSYNVNGAYNQALWDLHLLHREPEDSRNGKVIRFPEPVATTYIYPWERVLFNERRDANPFFHVFESLWMLAGRNDVAFPAKYAKQLLQYSDDGATLHGAYGYRWRQHFGYDQLGRVINALRRDPTTRRIVLGMWDPYIDLDVAIGGGNDVPCNTQVYFIVREGQLTMTVCNRSNDMIWGCYGANAVHMSILQEYVALSTGLPMGPYTQISNDLHMYEKHWDLLGVPPVDTDPYDAIKTHQPIFPPGQVVAFDQDVAEWLANPKQILFRGSWMQETVGPMGRAWQLHKDGFHASAIDVAAQIEAEDWRAACLAWLERRAPKLQLVKANV